MSTIPPVLRGDYAAAIKEYHEAGGTVPLLLKNNKGRVELHCPIRTHYGQVDLTEFWIIARRRLGVPETDVNEELSSKGGNQ